MHIPFCVKKCSYCDFPSYTGREEVFSDYAAALCRQIDYCRDMLGRRKILSVYFGGGTPSLLPPEQISRILIRLEERFSFSHDAEISVEANPDTIREPELALLRRIGFNRISIGVQSPDDGILREVLGRRHTCIEAERVLDAARRAGFTNINLDLLLGFPGEDQILREKTMKWLGGVFFTHISLYMLHLAENTPLAEKVSGGSLSLPDEDEVADAYEKAAEFLGRMGYRRYEVSNFSLPGCECRHNLHYWRYGPYLGLGASAVSRLEDRRWRNPDLDAYLKCASGGYFPREEEEVLSFPKQLLERIMLALRTSEGLDLEGISESCGDWKGVLGGWGEMQTGGLLRIKHGRMSLTERGLLVMNEIVVGLCRTLLDKIAET